MDDCHVLFLFDTRLNEHIQNVNDCNVPIPLASKMLVNRTDYLLTVLELAYSLGM